MAHSGINLGNSQLQVGARLRKLSIFLAIAMAISGSTASAATTKATPKPTTKATPKATAKPKVKVSIKPSAQSKSSAKPIATSKATSSPKSASSSKATVKPKAKPKVKRKPRKKIKLSPSPPPAWPPVGFPQPESGVYTKVPTRKELNGVISAKGNLANQVTACLKFVCGAVRVAAEDGCIWWEVDSKVYSKNNEVLGNLKTVTNGSSSREVKTILLISPESLETLEYIDNIEVACHQDARPDGLQSLTYTKVG